MTEPKRSMPPVLAPFAALLLSGCAGSPQGEPPVIRYVGSSTIGRFIADAERSYQGASFTLETAGESAGGEEAIRRGETALAGVAAQPSVAREGEAGPIRATLIGRDAIAVIVHPSNPVRALTSEQLRRVFRGEVKSWKELGGPELPVRPLIVAPESATRSVFRSVILEGEEYAGCEVLRPDELVPRTVAEQPGAIGQISFAFIKDDNVKDAGKVRAIAVDGQEPSVINFDYPIARPLYLLWREGNPAVRDLVSWAVGQEGQRVLMKRFVGIRVVDSVRGVPAGALNLEGQLVVATETELFNDGGTYYYPHLGYEVYDMDGRLVQRVRNRLNDNDERPTILPLPPGTYRVRAESKLARYPEFFVTIDPGKTTRLEVEELLRRK